MVVEEKESVMIGPDQGIETEEGKDLGHDPETEVSGKEVGDQGLEIENAAGPGQETTKRKVEGAPDLVQGIEGTEEIGKTGKAELKRMILILRKSLFGKTKLT